MLFKHCHCHDVLLAYLFQGFNLLLFIKEKLADVHKKRELYRQQRLNAEMPVVSLVGYTSSGKTTLFNMLQKKETQSNMFTTLCTTTRSLKIYNRNLLFIQSVLSADSLTM
jgi:GTPase